MPHTVPNTTEMLRKFAAFADLLDERSFQGMTDEEKTFSIAVEAVFAYAKKMAAKDGDVPIDVHIWDASLRSKTMKAVEREAHGMVQAIMENIEVLVRPDEGALEATR